MRSLTAKFLLTLFGSLLLVREPSFAEPHPVTSTVAKATGAAVFTHILHTMDHGKKKFLKENKANKLFLGAVDHKGKSVLSAATLQQFRRQGFYVYPDWDVSQRAPRGNYNYYQLSCPQQLSPKRIVWHCVQGRVNSFNGPENSSIESTFWLRKIGGKWKVEKSKITGGFY